MEVGLFTLHYFLLSGCLLLTSSASDFNILNICRRVRTYDTLQTENHSVHWNKQVDFGEDFSCYLNSLNDLNCSWSFPTLQSHDELFIYSGVCDQTKAVHPPSLLSKEKVGWKSMNTPMNKSFDFVLLFNISVNNSWGLDSYWSNTEMLERLPPPSITSASVMDGALVVKWALPHSRFNRTDRCFQYQLKVKGQDEVVEVDEELIYTMPNADPYVSYHISIRVKKSYCPGSPHWSEWGHTATQAKTKSLMNLPITVTITLVIPMFLLGLLLCLRLQRVADVLFPQIPDIPKKYKNVIERSDSYIIYPAEPFNKAEEAITIVEESNPADA